jgi:hypothetical protein
VNPDPNPDPNPPEPEAGPEPGPEPGPPNPDPDPNPDPNSDQGDGLLLAQEQQLHGRRAEPQQGPHLGPHAEQHAGGERQAARQGSRARERQAIGAFSTTLPLRAFAPTALRPRRDRAATALRPRCDARRRDGTHPHGLEVMWYRCCGEGVLGSSPREHSPHSKAKCQVSSAGKLAPQALCLFFPH